MSETRDYLVRIQNILATDTVKSQQQCLRDKNNMKFHWWRLSAADADLSAPVSQADKKLPELL